MLCYVKNEVVFLEQKIEVNIMPSKTLIYVTDL